MNIEIWSIGKANDDFIEKGVTKYLKKLQPYCNTKFEIISPKKSVIDPLLMKKAEEELVLKKLQPQHFLILLDEKGKLLSSPDWASQLQQMMNQSVKTCVFLIGGAYGVSQNIFEKANAIWSLSKLVFPHQLVRLILAEQLYRSFSILHNSGYHHE